MKKLSAYTYSQTMGLKARSSIVGTYWLDKRATRIMLLLRYLQASWNHRVVPWNFFQLNSDYFNDEKGIFSKLEMDRLIPEKWRLHQEIYDPERVPAAFPVFAKPEWGQNAMGIVRLENVTEFAKFALKARRAVVPYIVQQAAIGRREFEVYYLRSPDCPDDSDDYGAFFVTRVINRDRTRHPINSVYNPDTSYRDITTNFTEAQLSTLWNLVKGIGRFRMARLCLKADSRQGLLKGHFQVVEINLFLPMPLVLLADNVEPERKLALTRQLMETAARLVSAIPKGRKKWIFFRKLSAHYRIVT